MPIWFEYRNKKGKYVSERVIEDIVKETVAKVRAEYSLEEVYSKEHPAGLSLSPDGVRQD